MNPSGIYTLTCNGHPGTLELTVNADGDLINSTMVLFGEKQAISGKFDEITCLLEFEAARSLDHPNLQFKLYVMTLETENRLAFAGTASDHIPASDAMAPAETYFGWWATSQSVWRIDR